MQYMLVHAVDDELAAAKPWDEAAQASLEAWLDQTIGQKVNLHEALEWASKHPTAQIGAIEVRPLYDDQPPAGLPEPAPGKRRYLMLVCTDPSVEREELEPIAPVEPWVNEMVGRGARRYGSQLAEPARARTVRVRDGQALFTDGPFAETKEQIAGFDILDCADLDEAIEIAEKHPMARHGVLEVRPFWPF